MEGWGAIGPRSGVGDEGGIQIIRTEAPTRTREYRSITSSFIMRIQRVAVAVVEIERAGAERVVDAAVHKARQIGSALQHCRWRRPRGPFRLAANMCASAPFKARAPDADAVADRLTAPQRQIKRAPIGVDGDGARLLSRGIGDEHARGRVRTLRRKGFFERQRLRTWRKTGARPLCCGAGGYESKCQNKAWRPHGMHR